MRVRLVVSHSVPCRSASCALHETVCHAFGGGYSRRHDTFFPSSGRHWWGFNADKYRTLLAGERIYLAEELHKGLPEVSEVSDNVAASISGANDEDRETEDEGESDEESEVSETSEESEGGSTSLHGAGDRPQRKRKDINCSIADYLESGSWEKTTSPPEQTSAASLNVYEQTDDLEIEQPDVVVVVLRSKNRVKSGKVDFDFNSGFTYPDDDPRAN